jgi:hypothetical protein
MTAQVEPIVLDFGLAGLRAAVTHLTLCAAEPTSYAMAVAAPLGYQSFGAGQAFGAPATSSATLRAVSSVPVTAGTITTTGTAAWWAAIDETNSALYAHGGMNTPLAVTAGLTFALSSFNISVPQH